MTARLSPVAANSRRAQASMPSASGPPGSTRSPTGAPIASSATVAATSSAATNWILSLFDLNAGAIRSGAAAAPRLLGDQRQQTTGHVTAARAQRRLCRVARALRLLLVLGGAVLAVSGVGE